MAEAAPLSPIAVLARRHDPDRFLCALFAPAESREAMFALIAFNHELARAREAATNPLAAAIRLQWWREAVEEAAAGAPPRRHEVAAPLHAAIASGALDAGSLTAMADAREAETEEGGIPSREALHAYLRGTAGGFAVAAGRLLAAPAATLVGLQALGAAYGMAGLLRAVPVLAAQGRCLLPRDLLEAQGLNPETVLREPGAAGVRAVAAELAEDGRRWLAEGRAVLRGGGALPRRALAAALPAALAARDLRRVPDTGAPPRPRSLGDRLAVTLAGLRGRV
jgi:phytoene synthase